MAESVCVVVMAYNESRSLAAVVGELHEALARLGAPHELLIVDDGSSDGTGELADRLASETVRVIHHRPNGGLGAVYRTGLGEARGDLVTFFPADGQFPATILEQFVPLMAEADLLLGYIPDRGGSLLARTLSAGERVLYRLLFGSFPRFQGILMLRRRLLEGLPLGSAGRGWTVVMEMILRVARAGHRVKSVPTAFRPRVSGASKVLDLRTIGSNLRQVLELRLRL